ncbi:serine/threonine-protein kinase [Chiayiivirga flava]|uniref:Serine/threonine-protein kinase n=1 Tax=Chiayiivirga flava TaxID=659595 RepID=A0A7W8D7F1_9GAMM|nr:serine/threonine-protein kinase [Chiayiivirga flava]MBB5209299.1 serine/threonine-protein kinase [Chiayiivirga flava]
MSADARWEQVRDLFDRVCDLPPPQQRARLEADGVAPDLVDEVLALCNADTVGARVLGPVLGMLDTLAPELPPGSRLGPWRIVSTLAEGGMGRVYLADRDDGQYRQRVAIKLLRTTTGADAEQYFLRERQILADLQHPGIARLVDGGVSEDGTPYLVMEYIDGQRIDVWCESHRLDLPARLRLFADVCRTVQFAHAHLVLHCDLKPSNILVRDGVPVLLDFGIARLIGDVPEAHGAGYMTPRYASPEQRAGQPMSTASDIYSLGLILDELLAPSPATPEPTAAVHATRPTSARAARDGVRWAGRLRGDLDAIVRHATAREPAQRYASAGLIAEDIERWFGHFPLRARAKAGGMLYRGSRLLRRRWPVAAFGVLMLLMAGVFTWRLVEQRDRALAAERIALEQTAAAEQVIGFLTGIFEEADPEAGANPDITARELLDRGRAQLGDALAQQPQLRRRMLLVLGDIYDNIGLPALALDLFHEAGALGVGSGDAVQAAALQDRIAQSLLWNNRGAEAETAARAALAYVQANRLPARVEGNAWNSLGMILQDIGRQDEARAALEHALVLRRSAPDATPVEISSTLHNLGMVAREQDRLSDAEALLQQSLASKDASVGETHPRTLNTLTQLARVQREQGKLVDAETNLRRVLDLRKQVHGFDSPRVAASENDLGSVVHDLGRFAEAAQHYQRAIEIDEKHLGRDSAELAAPLNNLASAWDDSGDYARAVPLFERSLALRIANAAGADSPAVARAHANFARVLSRLGRHDEALAQWRLGNAMWARVHTAPNSAHLIVALNGGNIALARGDVAEAKRLLAQARTLDATLKEVFPLVRANVDRLDGRIAQAEGRNADAAAAFDRFIAVMQETFPADHPFLAEARLERLDVDARTPTPAQLDALAGPLERELVATHPARVRLGELRRSAG